MKGSGDKEIHHVEWICRSYKHCLLLLFIELRTLVGTYMCGETDMMCCRCLVCSEWQPANGGTGTVCTSPHRIIGWISQVFHWKLWIHKPSCRNGDHRRQEWKHARRSDPAGFSTHFSRPKLDPCPKCRRPPAAGARVVCNVCIRSHSCLADPLSSGSVCASSTPAFRPALSSTAILPPMPEDVSEAIRCVAKIQRVNLGLDLSGVSFVSSGWPSTKWNPNPISTNSQNLQRGDSNVAFEL